MADNKRSLYDFWAAQEKQVDILKQYVQKGGSINEYVQEVNNAVGASDLAAFQKLMQTQSMLAGMLNDMEQNENSVSSGMPNPVLDKIDLNDTTTMKRFDIQSLDCSDVVRGESICPKDGVMLLFGRPDVYTAAMKAYFTSKGLSVHCVEQNFAAEEEAAHCIEELGKGNVTLSMMLTANLHSENQNLDFYDYMMSVIYLVKHYTIHVRETKTIGRGVVLFSTFLDGKLGLTGTSKNYCYGTFNGIAKTLSIEFKDKAEIRLIDFEEAIAPDKMIELLEDELCIHDEKPEVGRTSDGKRWGTQGVLTKSVVEENRFPLEEEEVLLVTGGSRGVTAACVLELMKKVRCKVVILGRAKITEENADDEESAAITDLKDMKTLVARRFKKQGYRGPFIQIERKARAIMAQREMLQTFDKFQQLGIDMHYYSCDVQNREGMQRILGEIEREVGPIRGVIHGAGMVADCKIWNKQMDFFQMVFNTKYHGLLNVIDFVDKEKLKLVAAFSSISGYFGNDGQTDYSAGNEFLDKFAHSFRQQYKNCRTLAINWGPWDGGMMDYIYRKTLTEKGYYLIPLEVGANYFANELLNGLPSPQILISNSADEVDTQKPAKA